MPRPYKHPNKKSSHDNINIKKPKITKDIKTKAILIVVRLKALNTNKIIVIKIKKANIENNKKLLIPAISGLEVVSKKDVIRRDVEKEKIIFLVIK